MQPPHTLHLTPNQAHLILQRLEDEQRITPALIATYVQQLHDEIRQLSDRIAHLRSIAPNDGRPARRRKRVATLASSNASVARKRRRFSPTARAKQQLQGRYLGYMRQVAETDKPRFKAIKERKGFDAAIIALRKHRGE